jgi:hypothetical protein
MNLGLECLHNITQGVTKDRLSELKNNIAPTMVKEEGGGGGLVGIR